jgi:hypothetical protein
VMTAVDLATTTTNYGREDQWPDQTRGKVRHVPAALAVDRVLRREPQWSLILGSRTA